MNLSGYGDNLVYRNNIASADPYYYISTQLDLSGQSASNGIFYFNKDNNFSYLVSRDYAGFHKIDTNSVIGEVVAFSSPEMEYNGSDPVSRVSSGSILAVSRNSSVATIYLNASPSSFNLFLGDYISVSGITNDSNSFNTSEPTAISFASPAISKVAGANIVSVERDGSNVATITLSGPASGFGLATGDVVLVSGISNDSNSFNTPVPVAITVSGSTFTYSSTGGVILITAALGASKDVSFPANIQYSDPGSDVSVVAAAGGSRNISTPILFLIGGAHAPSSGLSSIDIWGGPTGNVAAPVSIDQLNVSQSCYYGSEPNDAAKKFLAVKLVGGNTSNQFSGILSIVVKVYPKFG